LRVAWAATKRIGNRVPGHSVTVIEQGHSIDNGADIPTRDWIKSVLSEFLLAYRPFLDQRTKACVPKIVDARSSIVLICFIEEVMLLRRPLFKKLAAYPDTF